MAMSIDVAMPLRQHVVDSIVEAAIKVHYSVDYETNKPNFNVVRRYRRLIRRVSGKPWVTVHSVENKPIGDGVWMVSFGTTVD